VAPARHGACKQDSWLLAIRHADTPGGHREARFADQPAGSAQFHVLPIARWPWRSQGSRHGAARQRTARGRSTSAKTAVTRERRSSPTTAGTARWVRVYGHSRKDVRRQLTKILEQADQGIPVAAESWTIAKYPAYRLGHVVRPERKPRTYQGYEGVVPDVKLVRQRPMAVVGAGQGAVVAPPATSWSVALLHSVVSKEALNGP
jgi:hypothetical protein